MSEKLKDTKNNRKKDKRFKKVNIKHGQSESARDVFQSRENPDYES